MDLCLENTEKTGVRDLDFGRKVLNEIEKRQRGQTRLQSPWQILKGAGQSVQATLGLQEKWLMALACIPAAPAFWHHLTVALPVIFHTASNTV